MVKFRLVTTFVTTIFLKGVTLNPLNLVAYSHCYTCYTFFANTYRVYIIKSRFYDLREFRAIYVYLGVTSVTGVTYILNPLKFQRFSLLHFFVFSRFQSVTSVTFSCQIPPDLAQSQNFPGAHLPLLVSMLSLCTSHK